MIVPLGLPSDPQYCSTRVGTLTCCTIGGGGRDILPQKPYLAVQSYPIPPPRRSLLLLLPFYGSGSAMVGDRQSGDQERR